LIDYYHVINTYIMCLHCRSRDLAHTVRPEVIMARNNVHTAYKEIYHRFTLCLKLYWFICSIQCTCLLFSRP